MGLLDAVEPALDAGAGILNLLHALDKGGNGTTLTMRHIALLQWQSVYTGRKGKEKERNHRKDRGWKERKREWKLWWKKMCTIKIN